MRISAYCRLILGLRWLAGQGCGKGATRHWKLRQGYARGEIDKQEFEARKRDLSP